MFVYAIREKATGKYIPNLRAGTKGGTHLEFEETRKPRLFPSEGSARSFIGNWLQGKMSNNHDGKREITPVPSRKRENIEIVEFEMIEVLTKAQLVKDSDELFGRDEEGEIPW